MAIDPRLINRGADYRAEEKSRRALPGENRRGASGRSRRSLIQSDVKIFHSPFAVSLLSPMRIAAYLFAPNI